MCKTTYEILIKSELNIKQMKEVIKEVAEFIRIQEVGYGCLEDECPIALQDYTLKA